MPDLEQYTPGPAAGAQMRKQEGENWTLIVTRDLRHSPEKVWQALTDPEHLRQWAPFDADGSLGTVGNTVKLTTVGAPKPHITQTTVTRADAPKSLEYKWGGNDMRWELEPVGGGTRLTLWTAINRHYIAMGAAGWHICFDVMDCTPSTPSNSALRCRTGRRKTFSDIILRLAFFAGLKDLCIPIGTRQTCMDPSERKMRVPQDDKIRSDSRSNFMAATANPATLANRGFTRTMFRWIHIVFSIPILGYIYSPFDKIPQYAFPTRFVFVPIMILSGLWMWKGHVVRRLLSKRSA